MDMNNANQTATFMQEKERIMKMEMNIDAHSEETQQMPNSEENRFGVSIPDGYEVSLGRLRCWKASSGKNTVPVSVDIGPALDVKCCGVFKGDSRKPMAVVVFKDEHGGDVEVPVPIWKKMGRHDFLENLGAMGYVVDSDSGMKLLVKFLIATYHKELDRKHLAVLADQTGWTDDGRYVLPDKVYGEGDELVPVILKGYEHYRQKGTLEEWQSEVASLAEGNPALEHALAASFAGILLKPFGFTTGIIYHYVGESSIGKSTTLRMANSVWGAKEQIKPWNSTVNGFEGMLAPANDNLAVLDELNEVSSRQNLLNIVYPVANGRGKVRMNANCELREQRTWLAVVLSSGEKALSETMASLGQKPTAGALQRMPAIPVAKEMIRDLHGEPDSGALVDRIGSVTQHCYGTAGRAFLERLTADGCRALNEAKESERLEAYCTELLEGLNADTQVKRTARHFALVMLAAELAQSLGVVPFDCRGGVKEMFDSYINGLETLGNSEEQEIVSHLLDYIQSNQHATFVSTASLGIAEPKMNKCDGYKDDKGTFWFYAEGFYNRIMSGWRKSDVNKALDSKKLRSLDSKGGNPKKTFGGRDNKRYVCITMPQSDADASEVPQALKPTFGSRRERKKIDCTNWKFEETA